MAAGAALQENFMHDRLAARLRVSALVFGRPHGHGSSGDLPPRRGACKASGTSPLTTIQHF